MNRALTSIAACAASVWAAAAHAAPTTIGVFAPSAPFPSTAARVELANRLAGELGKALGGAVSGRVYARAADFAAAVKSGEVALALVDPAYLASTHDEPAVLAAALYGGSTERAWQLVSRGGTAFGGLRGKRVLVPSLGGREADFVIDVLLGGAVGRTFFARIEAAPDTASALAALALGKVEAVAVPVTNELPPGMSVTLALPALPTPVLVAYRALGAPERAAVLAAVTAFPADATISGFRAIDAEVVRGVARRFAAPAKRAPFLVPALRGIATDLIEQRRFAIERTPATVFAVVPPTR